MLTTNQINYIINSKSLIHNDQGYGIKTYIGSGDVLGYGLFMLRQGKVFWLYNDNFGNEELIEKLTVIQGNLVVTYDENTFIIGQGETLDVTKYDAIITCTSDVETYIFVEMSVKEYEMYFQESYILHRDTEAIDAIDGYTYRHCGRIKDYTVQMWQRMKYSTDRVNLLKWAAYFHDLGKLDIPLEVLNKKEPLTDDEWELMKKHAEFGAQRIRNHEIIWLREAAHIVEQHHERYDGKGYPKGLKGDEISIEASIISIVDAFDAMTTNRVYRGALSMEEAIEEMKRGRGTQFNPIILDEFLEMLKENGYNWI